MSEQTTRIALMSCLRKQMETKPISRITVDELLEAAGVSRTTFYRLYLDKYDLMNSCYKTDIDRILSAHRLEDYMGTMAEIRHYIADNRQFLANAIKSNGQNSFPSFLLEYIENYYTELVKALSGRDTLTMRQRYLIAHNCAGWVSYLCNVFNSKRAFSEEDEYEYTSAVLEEMIESMLRP